MSKKNFDAERAREIAAFLSLVSNELIDYQLGLTPFLASDDETLSDWLLNASNFAGDFLRDMATAGLRADWLNYPLLRPFLLYLKQKYPYYAQPFTGIRPPQQ